MVYASFPWKAQFLCKTEQLDYPKCILCSFKMWCCDIKHAVCTIIIWLLAFVEDETDYIPPTRIFYDGRDSNAAHRQRRGTFTQQHWQNRDTMMIVTDARQVAEFMQRLRDIERARATDAENMRHLEFNYAVLQPVVTRLGQRLQTHEENIHELAKRTQG